MSSSQRKAFPTPDSRSDDDDLVFKALASATRRRMLDVLKASSCTTGELCEAFGDLDRTTVLQHLRVLERAELVTGRRVGRVRHLALAPLPIKRLSDRWIGEYARAAVDLLDTLDRPSRPPVTEHHLDALETEVRRTARGRRRNPNQHAQSHQEGIA